MLPVGALECLLAARSAVLLDGDRPGVRRRRRLDAEGAAARADLHAAVRRVRVGPRLGPVGEVVELLHQLGRRADPGSVPLVAKLLRLLDHLVKLLGLVVAQLAVFGDRPVRDRQGALPQVSMLGAPRLDGLGFHDASSVGIGRCTHDAPLVVALRLLVRVATMGRSRSDERLGAGGRFCGSRTRSRGRCWPESTPARSRRHARGRRPAPGSAAAARSARAQR